MTLSYAVHGYRAHAHMYGVHPVSVVLSFPPPCVANTNTTNNNNSNRSGGLSSSPFAGTMSGGGGAVCLLPSLDAFVGPAAASLRAQLLSHVAPYNPLADPAFIRARALFDPLVHYSRAVVGCLVLDTRAPVYSLIAVQRPCAHKTLWDTSAYSVHIALGAAASSSSSSSSSTTTATSTGAGANSTQTTTTIAPPPSQYSSQSPLSFPVVRQRLLAEAETLWTECLISLLTARGCAPVSATGDVFTVQVANVKPVYVNTSGGGIIIPPVGTNNNTGGKATTSVAAVNDQILVTLNMVARL
jgi:hypothetical protein